MMRQPSSYSLFIRQKLQIFNKANKRRERARKRKQEKLPSFY